MDWTFADNKVFENALAELGLECPNLVQKIALRFPEKSIEQIQEHYDALIRDVEMIESGQFDEKIHINNSGSTMSNNIVTQESSSLMINPSNVTPPKVPRKKPAFWSDHEHEAFLSGLEKYGKGDWKSISRFCVQTRTPTQIASHAQKYFQKLRKYANKQQQGVEAQSSEAKH
ncbi:Transcription factor DIVARICATA [Bienertia sinuspersici]